MYRVCNLDSIPRAVVRMAYSATKPRAASCGGRLSTGYRDTEDRRRYGVGSQGLSSAQLSSTGVRYGGESGYGLRRSISYASLQSSRARFSATVSMDPEDPISRRRCDDLELPRRQHASRLEVSTNLRRCHITSILKEGSATGLLWVWSATSLWGATTFSFSCQ